MTNKIIIDGWNVCWKIPEISEYIPDNLPMARKKLNIAVSNYFSNKKSVYKIIYDGQPGIVQSNVEFRNQQIQFSKKPQNADQKILTFLKLQKNPTKWTVITSDRELSGRAKNLGALIVSSEEFIQKINKKRKNIIDDSKKNNPNLSKDEIKNWLHLFNNSN